MNAKTEKIRVLLVDDHRIFREGLRASISDFGFLTVIGEAVDGEDALEKIGSLSPHVILMDLNMPKMSGLQATPLVRQRFPKTKVIALTMHDNKEYVSEILRCGAHGYVLKDTTPEQLVRAIQCVFDGTWFFSPPISRHVVDRFLETERVQKPTLNIELTKREKEVLDQLGTGKTSKQIAAKLGIGTRTAETFRARLMDKFKVANTAALIKAASEGGLIK